MELMEILEMAVNKWPSKHKYGAQPCQSSDGVKFPSKKQRDYYHKLMAAKASGALVFSLREVRIDLPGGIIYRIDFLEFWDNGDIVWTDVKGFATPVYKLKKKLVESHYPFKINEV